MSRIGDFFHSLEYFGFHGARVNSEEHNPFADDDAGRWNVITGVSLIPVIGQIIAGIMLIHEGRKFAGASDPNATEVSIETRRWCIGMGIANLCIVTYPLMLIAHLGATLGRVLTNPTGDE